MIKLAEIFSNLIINLVYFSRKDATYHSKKRTYSNKIVGYGISLIAFIATLYSFVSDKFDSKTKLFFFVVFTIAFYFSWKGDRSNQIINDLSANLEKDTKDLIYSYKRLKEHEIDDRFKDFFHDFTRYAPPVLGVQVYNYSIFSNQPTNGNIKVEYEYGAVQEGIDVNAVIQSYYSYNKRDITTLSKALLSLRLHNNANKSFEFLDQLSTRIKDGTNINQTSYELALWHILVSEIQEYGGVEFTIEQLERLLLNGQTSKADKRIGIFTAIVYSDLLKLREQHIFGYRGNNTSKESRLYVTIKSESVKGAKKIFLIILSSNGTSQEINTDDIISQFENLLEANSLVESSFKLNKKEGSIHDAIQHIQKNNH